MASISETGHTKNVANFKTLIEYLTSLGADYNPSKPSLLIPALKAQNKDAEAASTQVNEVLLPPYSAAVDKQQELFSPFSKLVTRVNASFKSSVTNTEQIETFQSIIKRIKSTPSGKDKNVDPAQPPGGKKSISQQSYDYRLKSFGELISSLEANLDYAPNEAELKSATLRILYTKMKAATEKVDPAEAALINGRIARDKNLYAEGTGVFQTAKDIKEYIKSVFGTGSVQLKFINQLKFTSPK